MILQDIVNRSKLICNIPIGQEAIVFYNEFLDMLCDSCPHNATNVSEMEFICDNPEEDVFKIPVNTLYVTDVFCDNKKIVFKNSDNRLLFPYKGVYKIKYTVYPKYAVYMDSEVNHNIIYDSALTYFICYKKALQEHYDESTVNYYLTNFSDHFDIARKKDKLKSRASFIPHRPFIG